MLLRQIVHLGSCVRRYFHKDLVVERSGSAFPGSPFLDRRNAGNPTAFNCGEASSKALL